MDDLPICISIILPSGEIYCRRLINPRGRFVWHAIEDLPAGSLVVVERGTPTEIAVDEEGIGLKIR